MAVCLQLFPRSALRIRVQLLDTLDGRLARSGVPITIRQKGPRVASIDGGRPGAEAVLQTNRKGTASFTIAAVRPSSGPVLLNANPPHMYLGHVASASGTLILRFRAR